MRSLQGTSSAYHVFFSLKTNNPTDITEIPKGSITPMGTSMKYTVCYNIGNNYSPLTFRCLVVYATKG